MSNPVDLFKQARKDQENLEKMANALSPQTAQYVKDIMRPALMTLAAISATGGISYLLAKNDQKKHEQALKNSFNTTFSRDPHFAKNPSNFAERFSELTVISPTIAKNPALSAKIIRKNFDHGFEIDDIHKLTAIESNSSHARVPQQPAAAGRAAALSGFGEIFRSFGPSITKSWVDAKHRLDAADAAAHSHAPNVGGGIDLSDDQAQEIAKRMMENKAAGKPLNEGIDFMTKKSSSQQLVSDEVLGTMLSERHIMLKQAGIDFKPGMDALKNSFALMAPALALGGGAALIANVLESRRNAQLSNQADAVFKGMKSQDFVQQDPHAAHEAFETLKAFAPSLAARPQVASTFVRNVVNAGQLPPDSIAMLAEAENKVRGIQTPKGGFLNAFKSNVDVVKGIADFANMGTNQSDKVKKITERSKYFGNKS